MKNLTTKIIQVIAFLQGIQFVQPKRTDSRENYISISVTKPNPICEGTPEGEYPVTVPEEVLCGFRFTVMQKSSYCDLIFINNVHVHLCQQFYAVSYKEFSIATLWCLNLYFFFHLHADYRSHMAVDEESLSQSFTEKETCRHFP